jgi:hypothetical protein
MDFQTIITIILGSSTTTIFLGWLKEIYFDKREEKRKRLQIQEESYRDLMKCIDFIYKKDTDPEETKEKKEKFLKNYRLLFLHAPDKVVKGINNFLDVMTENEPIDSPEMKDKKSKIADSMIILRKQIVNNTKLTNDDFRHVT